MVLTPFDIGECRCDFFVIEHQVAYFDVGESLFASLVLSMINCCNKK